MAYVETTTIDYKTAERISQNLAVVMGKTDLTTYNTTGVEITDITKYFKTLKRVIADGFSDNLYGVRWNTTDKCFHAFAAEGTDSEPFLEVANGVDVGEINWIAIGLI